MSTSNDSHDRRVIVVAVTPTGPDPTRHSVAEIAAVDTGTGQRWHLAVPLSMAERKRVAPGYLEPSDYKARGMDQKARIEAPAFRDNLATLAAALEGNTLASSFPEFVAAHLADLFRRWGLDPMWHHRMADIGALTAGAWRIPATKIPRLPLCCRLWKVPLVDLHTPVGESEAVAACLRAFDRHLPVSRSCSDSIPDLGPPRRHESRSSHRKTQLATFLHSANHGMGTSVPIAH